MVSRELFLAGDVVGGEGGGSLFLCCLVGAVISSWPYCSVLFWSVLFYYFRVLGFHLVAPSRVCVCVFCLLEAAGAPWLVFRGYFWLGSRAEGVQGGRQERRKGGGGGSFGCTERRLLDVFCDNYLMCFGALLSC